jgi:tRNA-dihydrouridine synthase
MYKGEANWDLIRDTKSNPRLTIPVFGNGDINSPEKALEYKDKFGVDGIMIGRASIGHPWIFNEIKHYLKTGKHLAAPTIHDRVQAAKIHLSESIRWKGLTLGILEMRRHYTNYFRGLPGIKEYRLKLVNYQTEEEIIQLLDEIHSTYG